jgi:hypothetical protein
LTKPPSEAALRHVRDIILGADRSMRERIQYGITFSRPKAATSPRSSGTASPA